MKSDFYSTRPRMIRFAHVVILTILLSGCGKHLSEFELDEMTFDKAAYDMIEEGSGLDLPPSSRGLNFFYQPPMDPSFVAKVLIPNESRDILIERVSQFKESNTTLSNSPTAKLAWWMPAGGRILFDRQTDVESAYMRVVIVEEDGDTILYLEHHVN